MVKVKMQRSLFETSEEMVLNKLKNYKKTV